MTIDIENSKYAQKAMNLFYEGYNCSQAVFLAFSDKYDMDYNMALRLSSSFGGGMGKLREVCGCVSGMFMVAGILYGYDDVKSQELKKEHYACIQQLAAEFEKENGSIVCRTLLGIKNGEDLPEPAIRTEEYYKKRPCVKLVGMAAAIMEAYIEERE